MMKDFSKMFANITMVTQIGLSLLMPLLLCILLAWYLNSHFNIGAWVFIPAFILGMGSSILTGYKMYKSVMRKLEKENKKNNTSFNRHL